MLGADAARGAAEVDDERRQRDDPLDVDARMRGDDRRAVAVGERVVERQALSPNSGSSGTNSSW